MLEFLDEAMDELDVERATETDEPRDIGGRVRVNTKFSGRETFSRLPPCAASGEMGEVNCRALRSIELPDSIRSELARMRESLMGTVIL